MRPRRSMPVASTTTRAAPELASIPRCVMCQSEATPSSALYWHMGETTMRFASSRSASLMGENRALVMSHALIWRQERRRTIGNGAGRRKHPGQGLSRGSRALRRRNHAGGNSSRRAAGCTGSLSVLRRDIIRWRRRDLGPSLAQSDGFAHTIKKLLLAVIMLPPPAVIELEKMCAPTFGQEAPLLGDLVECMPGEPYRHGCRNARCS